MKASAETLARLPVLILYSSVDGHTREICERIRQRLAQAGLAVGLEALENFAPDPGEAPALVIIGASIRYGCHRPALERFVRAHRQWLAARRTAFFSVCLTARKPGKDTPTGNPYTRRFLQRSRWRPDHVAIFAGLLDYPRYRPFDRLMIRLIMRLTGGPTDPGARVCYTDWQAVDGFASTCLELTNVLSRA